MPTNTPSGTKDVHPLSFWGRGKTVHWRYLPIGPVHYVPHSSFHRLSNNVHPTPPLPPPPTTTNTRARSSAHRSLSATANTRSPGCASYQQQISYLNEVLCLQVTPVARDGPLVIINWEIEQYRTLISQSRRRCKNPLSNCSKHDRIRLVSDTGRPRGE